MLEMNNESKIIKKLLVIKNMFLAANIPSTRPKRQPKTNILTFYATIQWW